MEISPALSKVLRETPAGMPMDISSQYGNTLNPHSSSSVLAMSAFMNDNTVQAALRKGFLLSNLRLKSVQTGSEYEYIVFNLKDVMVPHRLEEIMKKDRMLDMIKASELRGHNAWKQDAPKGDRTVTTYLEIVSANEFPARKLFLTYSMHLPSGWNLRTGNITDGDNMNALANFGYDENARWGGLQGSTHIASAYPSFNSTSRLLSRPLYRGIFYKLSLTSLSRMLLGIAFMLISVASVVLGAVYPFWIIPALVIFFVGSQDLSARRITAVTTQNSSNKGKQLEHEVHSIPEDNIVCFNHLVNLSFDMRDITEKALFSPTADQPIIFFQVYSCGLFHRSILEGCGYFILPNKAGSFEIEIDTWKAVGNLRSRMHEFFVGDHVKLKDEDFPNAIDIASKTLNKFGVLTHSSGSVKFKGQIIVVDPKMAKQNKEEVTQTSGQDSGRKTNRSVADILSTYRSQQSGRKPPLTDFGSKLSNRDSAGAGRPSVKSILEGISATAKASRSNEVLARIRTGRKNQTSSTSNPDESESSPLLASHAASLGETLNSSNSESLGLEERKEILQNAKTFSHRYDGKEADDFEMKQPSASVTPTKAADERKESKSSSPREDGKSPLLEAK